MSRLATAVAISIFIAASALSSSQDEDGRTIYVETGCATCHGADGAGTAAGPAVTGGALSLSDFVAYVRKPAGTMRAYGPEALSDEALENVYRFLESADGGTRLRGRVDVGTEVYRRVGCYECHSNEAQGGAQGPRLGPDAVSFSMFAWYTRHPSGAMPPYTEKVLSDQDLADIYAFVESRPEPPPLSSIPLLAPPR